MEAITDFKVTLVNCNFISLQPSSAKFSFDTLDISAQNGKVNKCSHTNLNEQMSIWAYEEPQFFPVPNHRPPPLRFLPGIYVFTNQS